MGKRIIQQARGKGSLSYRVKRSAYKYRPNYPIKTDEEYTIVGIVTEAGHSAPMVKLVGNKGSIFYNIAVKNVFVGQKIKIDGNSTGDITHLGNLENTTVISNIELRPNDGGKFIRTSGTSAVVLNNNKETGMVTVLMPSKKEKVFSSKCRATIGEVAGQGRLEKPVLKAGKMHFIKKSRNKLWPRTSAVKVNAIDHPFGSGRGKRIKSKISKRFSAPGQKVGHLRPRRTGRKK